MRLAPVLSSTVWRIIGANLGTQRRKVVAAMKNVGYKLVKTTEGDDFCLLKFERVRKPRGIRVN